MTLKYFFPHFYDFIFLSFFTQPCFYSHIYRKNTNAATSLCSTNMTIWTASNLIEFLSRQKNVWCVWHPLCCIIRYVPGRVEMPFWLSQWEPKPIIFQTWWLQEFPQASSDFIHLQCYLTSTIPLLLLLVHTFMPGKPSAHECYVMALGELASRTDRNANSIEVY